MIFNPNNPFQDSQAQLSPRAAQMLRELQDMRAHDSSIPGLSELAFPEGAGFSNDPLFSGASLQPEILPSPKVEQRSSFFGLGKKSFSREAYLKDVRGSMIGRMLISTVSMGMLIVVSLVSIYLYFSPILEEMRAQAEVIERIPGEIVVLTNQIKDQNKRRQSLAEQHANLIEVFPTQEEALASYAEFLAALENQKVWVVDQKTSASQTESNPILATANLAEITSGNAKQAPSPQQQRPVNTKAKILNGDLKPGLNYYHLEFSLEGSYVGYLSARQKLINKIPNLIVHQESVQASTKVPGFMDIKVFMSIPLIYTP
jgi:hypothetical protein